MAVVAYYITTVLRGDLYLAATRHDWEHFATLSDPRNTIMAFDTLQSAADFAREYISEDWRILSDTELPVL